MKKRRIKLLMTSLGQFKWLFVLLFFLVTAKSIAQPYGNEWIDYNKTYFKLSLAQDGIYRVTFNNLQDAGFPISSVDPRRIQLFYRGVEQAIFIQGQEDANFDQGDFIEFYGKRNDGTLDTELYLDPSYQPHKFYNLFSDSSAYYLTFNLGPTNGKRMPTFSENNVTSIPEEVSHENEILSVYTDAFSRGRVYPEGGSNSKTWLPQFDLGEGWIGPRIQLGQFQDFNFTLTNALTTGSNPRLIVRLVGNNNRDHDATIQVGASAASLRTVATASFQYHEMFLFDDEIAWSDIGPGGELTVRINVDPNGGADVVSPGFIQLFYPQTFDMAANTSQIFHLSDKASDKSYVEISNSPTEIQIYDITDEDNIRKIGFNSNGADIDFVINNTIGGRDVLVNGASPLAPIIQRVTMREFDPGQSEFVIISHMDLKQPAADGLDPVKAYATYRSSAEGGGYDTLVVTINELYDQFTFGEITPLAIRRFADYLLQGGRISNFFLIGKPLSLETKLSGTEIFYRKSPGSFSLKDLVPTFGSPGSDAALIAGLQGSGNITPFGIGRLTARNPDNVMNYLNKVKEMEATPFDAIWRKNLIHLSGGQSASELVQFANFVDNFKNIAEDAFLGARVFTINKNDNSVSQLFNVSEQVNAGVSLITFYGHSASALTDVEIGNVSNDLLGYDNKGRYPTILVNGCNAGDIFNTSFTFGEDWIFTPDRGALNFMAHSTTGFVNQLRNHTNTFYNTAYGDVNFIDKSLGEIVIESNRRFLTDFGVTPKNLAQAQEIVLQGDPAVKLFGASEPDYVVVRENIFFEGDGGAPVSANDELLTIKVIVENFGRVDGDSITINVNRTFSDGTVVNYDTLKFPPVFYADTLTIPVTMGGNAAGNNLVEISIDGANLITEIDETNNIANTSLFIPLAGTQNVLPYNFAIENSQPVTLKSQTTDPFSATRTFLFELDTVNTFDSPFKKTTTIDARVVANWEIDLLDDVVANDSVVYFWRTKYASLLPGEEDIWDTSSFTYIKDGNEGWSQGNFDQFLNSSLEGLVRNEANNSWGFIENTTSIEVTTFGELHPDNSSTNVILTVEDIPFIIGSPGNRICRDNSINLLAFDHQTGLPYVVVSFGNRDVLDARRCGRVPQLINNFTDADIVSALLIDQYIDGVDDEDFVLLLSIGTVNYQNFPASTLAKLEEIGISSNVFSTTLPGEPIIAFGRKGSSPGDATVVLADAGLGTPLQEQQITFDRDLITKFQEGSITSQLIGPATSWSRFYHKATISDMPQTDNFVFDIYGVTQAGTELLLFDNVPTNDLDLSPISVSTYPYLRIKMELSDDVNLTPPQLKKWFIFYDPAAEGIVYLTEESVENFNPEQQEGEIVNSELVFENISSKSFADSLSVDYSLFNLDTRSLEEFNFKIKEPAPGEATTFNLEFDTKTRSGKNSLNVFVNPRIEPEVNYNNNILDIANALVVVNDTINPVIDVSFDGVYILDGEIVSPNPLISITMKDENKTLLKEDTLGVTVLLGVPCVDCTPDENCQGCQFKTISFSSPEVNWSPATDQDDFKVEFRPETLSDGLYTLLVQAEDASGNESGTEPYRIRFEVINESSITNFYPYPNPFSTSTRFVFTLTGTEIPDELKIQIMTVSGKIVREITQSELGPIRVGNNLSDYAWDGRDEYGDQLANGVYLYRVVMGSNSTGIKHRETAADKAFKKGFGKLYILR